MVLLEIFAALADYDGTGHPTRESILVKSQAGQLLAEAKGIWVGS